MLQSYVPTGMKGNDDDDEHILNVVFCFPGTGVMTEGLAVQGVGGYSLN